MDTKRVFFVQYCEDRVLRNSLFDCIEQCLVFWGPLKRCVVSNEVEERFRINVEVFDVTAVELKESEYAHHVSFVLGRL